jgi:hypothetical protein
MRLFSTIAHFLHVSHIVLLLGWDTLHIRQKVSIVGTQGN